MRNGLKTEEERRYVRDDISKHNLVRNRQKIGVWNNLDKPKTTTGKPERNLFQQELVESGLQKDKLV